MEVKQKYPEDQSVPRIALAGYLFLRLIIPSLCTPERYNLANGRLSAPFVMLFVFSVIDDGLTY